jgi:hypothetical protein
LRIGAGASEVIVCYLDEVDIGSTPADEGAWVLHEHGETQSVSGARTSSY